MTSDDIIRMVREADLTLMSADAHCREDYFTATRKELERFAALVEQNLIANGYRQCAVGQHTSQFCGQLEAAVAAEREACAKVCEEQEDEGGEWDVQQQCANAIRARRK